MAGFLRKWCFIIVILRADVQVWRKRICMFDVNPVPIVKCTCNPEKTFKGRVNLIPCFREAKRQPLKVCNHLRDNVPKYPWRSFPEESLTLLVDKRVKMWRVGQTGKETNHDSKPSSEEEGTRDDAKPDGDSWDAVARTLLAMAWSCDIGVPIILRLSQHL
jgi:hypothetical protein